jgi:hypothetical protein
MWSAWECATFAELSGDKTDQARLFEVGYKAGQRFVEAVQQKRISPERLRAEAPMFALMLMQGPTAEFMIRRMFEGAMGSAFDEVVKEDANDRPIFDPDKWVHDDELKVSRAKYKYSVSNCAVIHQDAA